MNNKEKAQKIIGILNNQFEKWSAPVQELEKVRGKDPFKILLSTIISLRTKDEVTIEASKRLFKILSKPKDINKIKTNDIEKAIYPAGFYKNKSKQIEKISYTLLTQHDSTVPDNRDELIKFEGIGRKTANLILAEGYNQDTICVDTHVHRISNRIGFIKTHTPYETEIELEKILHTKLYKIYNKLLVGLGQTICKPISPKCSMCPIENLCQKEQVINHR